MVLCATPFISYFKEYSEKIASLNSAVSRSAHFAFIRLYSCFSTIVFASLVSLEVA